MLRTTDDQLASQTIIAPDDFHDCIPRISEVASVDLDVPKDLTDRLSAACDRLLIAPKLLQDCVAALISGNVVLQGSPGTGKSSLARALASAFNVELMLVTAHEDWSTFEIIGRQELRVRDGGREEIVPVNGHFTEAVIRCAGNIPKHQDDPEVPQATWLLIDELNRAHPDRAFGELFSVLGSDAPLEVTLGYQTPGNDVLTVPRRFRIIATINTVDNQFVNALSQGLRRRFRFLTFDIPPKRPDGENWKDGSSLASQELRLVLEEAAARAGRKLNYPNEDLLQRMYAEAYWPTIVELFETVEQVRYAEESDQFPFIPIGTAPLIDTIELSLIRAIDAQTEVAFKKAIDWAFSVCVGPLFDSGGVNREKLRTLANALAGPFANETRRALLTIESDGMFHVKHE